MIDLRPWDTHQHDSRILPDGSINVDPCDLLDLKTRLRKVPNAAEPDATEVTETVR